jgi:phage shock protein PspC (stress-responsive transcriptional regulator)
MKRWYRDSKNGNLGGICAGISEILEIDVTLVRFVWFMMIFAPVPAVAAYIIAWLIVPDKEKIHANNSVASTTTANNSSPGSKEFLTG